MSYLENKTKVTEQELSDELRLVFDKASKIDETLSAFYLSILQEVNRISRIDDNSRHGEEPIGAYPDGITVMRINAPGKLFPTEFGTVLTIKAGSYGFQMYSQNTAGPGGSSKVSLRTWDTVSGKWASWDEPETALGALEKANKKVDKGGDAMTGYLTLHSEPTEDRHAATKRYVDSVVQGLDIKDSVRAASTSSLPVSVGGSKQIRLSSALTSLDGVTLRTGDRILIKSQTSKRFNGIYVYTNSTTLDRAEDADDPLKLHSGMYTYVEEGTINGGSSWTLITPGPITIGSTELEFTQFSGANLVMAGEGIEKSGNTYSIKRPGVIEGSYTKVSVNRIGQVTSGAQQTEADIPSLSASKIGSGKFNIERLPTGTTASTVALGNHTHTLPNLSGVSIATPKENQALVFDGTSWRNKTMSGADLSVDGAALGTFMKHDGSDWTAQLIQPSDIPEIDASKVATGKFSIGRVPTGSTSETVALGDHKHTLAQLTDTTITAPAAGQVLTYSGTRWENRAANLSDLGDFNLVSASSGDFLRHNGTKWENKKLTASDIPNLDTSKITTGTLALARLPIGTTSATVSRGDHTHKAYEDRIAEIEADLPAIDYGLKGEIPFVSADNSNNMTMDKLIKEAAMVNTEEDLNLAKTVFVKNKDIFDTWERFSHGPGTFVQPGLPAELNGWMYDELNDLVMATINSTSHIGFVSKEVYDSYVHEVTLASDNGDDDTIGVLLAAAVVDGRMHTLTALRCNDMTQGHNHINGAGTGGFAWAIVYNYQMPDARIIANGTSSLTSVGATPWSSVPNGTKVSIVRNKDIITAKTSEMNSTAIKESTALVVDLNSDADLRKFRGPRPYGYTSFSQSNSTYKNIYFSNSQNVIYDIRSGNVWVANQQGVYGVDSTKKVSDLGIGRLVANTSTGKMFYIKSETETIEVGTASHYFIDNMESVILPAISEAINSAIEKEVHMDQTINAGAYYEYNIGTDFITSGENASSAFSMPVMVLVKDTDSTSPTYNHYINSEAVITVSRVSSTVIRFYNEYTSALSTKITIKGKAAPKTIE